MNITRLDAVLFLWVNLSAVFETRVGIKRRSITVAISFIYIFEYIVQNIPISLYIIAFIGWCFTLLFYGILLPCANTNWNTLILTYARNHTDKFTHKRTQTSTYIWKIPRNLIFHWQLSFVLSSCYSPCRCMFTRLCHIRRQLFCLSYGGCVVRARWIFTFTSADRTHRVVTKS